MIKNEKERVATKAVEAMEHTALSGITANQHIEVGGQIYKLTIERL
ncbi:hypothetical protein [Fructobacillus tropaeoli]|uniref:Uncharacterized protein n=1 Tax=Fructobacillus tropaeoli TaxID=709323 RepID=A0A3F3H3Z9_9LACO|nr:hypothetical protein [Fructobacillus tropaeoli]GAP05144.1 hypothetical protein FTRO_0740020 [Fructobacillus tropaeoli]